MNQHCRAKLLGSALLPILFVFALFCPSLCAKALRPLQIYLPGNFNGGAASFNEGLKVSLSKQWALPALANSLIRLKERDTVTIGLGGNASLFSPVGFLFGGEVENALLNEFKPDARMVGASELELLAGKCVPQAMLSHILTNHSTADGKNLFKEYALVPFSGGQVLIFNFIEPDLLKVPPLFYSNFRPENPVRSLLRAKTLLNGFNDKTITFSAACLNKKSCLALANELKKLKGIHIIAQIQSNGLKSEFSTVSIERQGNVFIFSLPACRDTLPIIEIFFKSFGLPRLRLRMPSSAKQRLESEKFFPIVSKIKNELVKPLKVISPSTQPTESVFSFKPSALAKMLNGFNSANAGMAAAPCARCFTSNVICKGHILSAFENDRVFALSLTGSELTAFLSELIYKSAHSRLAFAGIELKWAAHRLIELKINGEPCLTNRRYFINTTEHTLKYLKGFGLELKAKCLYNGNSLWEILLSQLKGTNLTDNELITK